MYLLRLLRFLAELFLLIPFRCFFLPGKCTELPIPGHIDQKMQQAHVALLILNGNDDGNGDQQHSAKENGMKGKIREQKGCCQAAANGENNHVCHADAPEKFHFYIDLFRYDSHKSFLPDSMSCHLPF